MCPGEVHATIAVVSAPSFHLPEKSSLPIIMVGPGTGIAPFRSFWQQRMIDMEMMNVPSLEDKKHFGDMVLYFGCRTARQDNIYGKELEDMEKAGVLTNFYVAFAPSFHLPEKSSLPIIMVGPGTGIAPFRSFWQQRMIDMEMMNVPSLEDKKHFGDMVLYFGCRTARQDNIYGKELEDMEKAGVLTNFYDILLSNAPYVYEAIVKKGGHFYVCGDVSMAHDVTQTLEVILQDQGKMDAENAAQLVTKLREANRFHEDIFGVSIRKPGEPRRSKDQTMLALEYLTAAVRAGKLDALRERAKPILFVS
uniref:Oxidoreductase FAD/NAD(P)-binding domain-containing protein n=1 Tax=Biomphalaria glabrata TaxID=6526 RepID=A0A182YTP5_BIOGL